MAPTGNDRRVDYIEFAAQDLPATKSFYERVFAWKFTDYGPEYISFDDGRLTGGFWASPEASAPPLVILYAANLEAVRDAVVAASGRIVKEIFAFPGGRRFHFADPAGNVLAVWSE